MNALERIIKILSAIEEEKESLSTRMRVYMQLEETAKTKEEQNKSMKKLLVVSDYIADELSKPKEPVEKLSIEEKTETILLLNKRLSQVNNTQEKAQMIVRVITSYRSNNISSSKYSAFRSLIIKRLIEQIRAQVSANKDSALGYAYFLLFLSNEMEGIIEAYKYAMFSSVVPFDCLLGMYRVYFTLLKTVNNFTELWEFVASLLNYTEGINTTFNPSILLIFLDILFNEMSEKYGRTWDKIVDYIRDIYLPLVDSKYKTETQQISSIISRTNK